MGCAPSLGARVAGKESVSHGGNAVEKYAPPPPVPVTVGSGIARRPGHSQQAIIFVFGGPGSQKGLIMEELSSHFDFLTLNVEDIVFMYLPNKVNREGSQSSSEGGGNPSVTQELLDLLKKDTGALTLEWLLSIISAKLSTSMSQRFAIDVIPCLTTLLKADSFNGLTTADVHKALANFEKRHPVMFALELNVSDERALIGDANGTANGDAKENGKDLSAELSAFLKGIDEADKGRLEKRLDAYHRCAAPFIDYFHRSRRTIRMDIFGPSIVNVVATTRDLFLDFGFSPNSHTRRVVLFAINDERFDEIDFEYYRMTIIRLSDVVHDHSENLISQLRKLHAFVRRTGRTDENVAVVLDTVNNTENPKAKRINFMEKKTVFLDNYIRDKLNRAPLIRKKIQVNAISTHSEEILLFLEPFSTRLAKKVALIFGESSSGDDDTATPTSTADAQPSPTL